MATLNAEDVDFHSSLSIEPGEKISINAQANLQADHPLETQTWQYVRLILKNGVRTLAFETPAERTFEKNDLSDAVGDLQSVAHAYLLCRSPQDEALDLATKLIELAEDKRSQVLFEPAEPSFELSLKGVGGGLKLEFFVDAGNVETGIYRWDALGIRFFTNIQAVAAFAAELKAEFAC